MEWLVLATASLALLGGSLALVAGTFVYRGATPGRDREEPFATEGMNCYAFRQGKSRMMG